MASSRTVPRRQLVSRLLPGHAGFGLGDTREEYWPVHGLASHTEVIDMFADALCVDEFFLSGNSMGCMNTVQYLCAYPLPRDPVRPYRRGDR